MRSKCGNMMEPFGFQDSHSFRCQIWNQFNLIGSKSKKRKVKIDYDQKRFGQMRSFLELFESSSDHI